ncbi:MAG: phospholipase C precursor [Benniella sp.]|nr:MAG: phospholipase C precursor [Benniella sp.]
MKLSTLLPLATAIATTVMPPSVIAAGNSTLSVLSNNVYFLPSTVSNWAQTDRAKLIANSAYIKNHDVVVIQECFDNSACDELRKGLRSQYPHQGRIVGGDKSSLFHANGGTLILSKWPIKKEDQMLFENLCGSDSHASKGVAYAVIDRDGVNVHVFGTHMQSEDTGCSKGQDAENRAEGANAWREFIDKLNIPADELVILAGDFNIKRDTPEFKSFLDRLDVDQPTKYNGHAWTWDTERNEIARYNYPKLVPEYLDYIFTDRKHRKVKSAVQTVLMVKAPEYDISGVAYHEYSDHYPVRVVIEL